jgi:predicted PurR-regulated permease PerM
MSNPEKISQEHRKTVRMRKIVIQIILLVTGAGMLGWILYQIRSVLVLLALTVIFCYLIAPVVDLIEHPLRISGKERRIPRSIAIILVYLLLAGLIYLAIERMLPVISDQFTAFSENLPGYARQFNQSFRQLAAIPARYRLPQNWRQSLTDWINSAGPNLVEWLKAIAGTVFKLSWYLPWLVLIPVIGFFFLKDTKRISDRVLATFPEADMRYRVAIFLNDVSFTLAAYIRAQLLACLIVGVIEGVGLWSFGISYPLLFGLAAGLLEFIPVIGPMILGATATLVVSFHSLNEALVIAGFLLLFRLIHDYVIYPRLISEGMQLHPVAVILAVLSGAELAGVLGVFLSIPMAALMLVGWKHWRDLQLDRAGVIKAQVGVRAGDL